MTQGDGETGPAQDDYWEQEVTMTRAQLQSERDAWYENGLRNGGIRSWDNAIEANKGVLRYMTARAIGMAR